MPFKIPLADRMAAKTIKGDGCWLWTGATKRSGKLRYPVIWRDGQNRSAMRAALELAGRPAPRGDLEPDHLCRNTLCVNPDHLEWVTSRVNTLRSNNPAALNARKTHCKRGHALAGDNLRVNTDGERVCRACDRMRALRYHHERRAVAFNAQASGQGKEMAK